MRLYTIGHSTRSFDELVDLLRKFGVQVLADVRRWPGSRRHPQFNREKLEESLPMKGIKYVWLGEELGGYRRDGLGESSPNKAWESQGFRNYADHTFTEEFRRGVGKLLRFAKWNRVAYMCAEKFYWRCHRRIISDYLKANGHEITHIIGREKTVEHKLPGFAEVKNGELRHPHTK